MMSKTSRSWPYTRAIGKALTIPGTKIGLSILTDIQDQLSADEVRLRRPNSRIRETLG